jgi:hypothetical protein
MCLLELVVVRGVGQGRLLEQRFSFSMVIRAVQIIEISNITESMKLLVYQSGLKALV